MIEGLQPYAKTTNQVVRTSEVNIPWLISRPEHWSVVRSKRLFRARTERARPDDDQLSATQAYGVIPQAEYEAIIGRRVVKISMHLEKRRHVEKDDFVISMRSFQGGLERAWARGCIRSSYVVLQPASEVQVGYFAHLFKCQNYIGALQATSNFIRDGQDLNMNNFKLVDLPLPPADEQSAIARYLDHANRKIDGFIRAKRKLIALLGEQKQAIIHRAVTRGLDPNAPLKPSGTPWLGDTPKHWEVVRSRRLFTVRTELARKDDVQLSSTQAYGVIPQAEYEAIIGRRVVKISMHLEKRRHVEKDDFVISMRSFQGGVERAWAAGAIRSSYVVMKPDPCVDATFFSYVLKSPGYIRALQATADFIRDGQDLTYANFRMVDLPLMPPSEQQKIAHHIESATKGIQTSLDRTEREISLMQEFRTRLTADVVTGKLDAREAAAKLPAQTVAESVTDEALDELAIEETP